MKWTFAMKLFEVIFVLWCCVVTTNAQNSEPFGKISTSFVHPSPTAVVSTMNASKTSPSSQITLVKGQTSVPLLHSSVKGARTIINSTMTVIPTTVHSTTGPMNMEDVGSTVALILAGCFLASVVIVVVVGLLIVLYKYKKRMRRRRMHLMGSAPDHHIQSRPIARSHFGTCDEMYDNDPDLAESSAMYACDHQTTNEYISEEATMPGTSKLILITPSMRPELVKKIITTDGGVIAIEDIILKIGPGCLAKDTEITLRNSDKDVAIKSLLDLRLVVAAPRVVEFLPDGLKFLKPADLTITFQNIVSNTELFVLHGYYNPNYQNTTIWELVTNGIEERNVEGVCNTKINGFCFYMFILATRGMLARILSHLNHSFTCRAYTLYRRLSSLDTIDISVVLLSEFVDDDKGEDIKQLNDHLDLGYVKGEKELLKRIHTDRRLEMSLHFPGVENTPFSFHVDQPQLDSVGFVIDHFQEIAVKSPASGKVKISEVYHRNKNESLWRMNIREMEEQIKVEVDEVQYSAPNPEPEVVYSNTKLTKGEITRMSCMVGLDWDSLAGLMNIPYSEREEIRVDCGNYVSISSKAKKVFELFNDSTFFDRHILIKYFRELGRHDLEKELLPVDQNGSEEVETSPTLPETTEEDLLHTPLSPREMSRLGRRIVVEWDRLAGFMDIPRAERDEIRYSLIYNDSRSRAEKIFAIFNNREGFSREKLARCLEEIQQLDLIKPLITGEWRIV